MRAVSNVFQDRIVRLSVEAGHVGMKLDNTGSEIISSYASHFFNRVGMVSVACLKKDVRGSDVLQEILVDEGKYFRLKKGAAFDDRYRPFWMGGGFSTERTVAGVVDLDHLCVDPILDVGMDPFVMENPFQFMKSRGRNLIAELYGDDSSRVVSAIVGAPDRFFFFGEPYSMERLARKMFARCGISERYINYSKGAFCPIEEAITRIRKRSSNLKHQTPGHPPLA